MRARQIVESCQRQAQDEVEVAAKDLEEIRARRMMSNTSIDTTVAPQVRYDFIACCGGWAGGGGRVGTNYVEFRVVVGGAANPLKANIPVTISKA